MGNIILRDATETMSSLYAVQEGGQGTVASREIDTAWTVVSVTDTGVGIAEENREEVLESRFTTKVGGIGLGLAPVKTLVEENEGSIEVQSRLGEGSTSSIRLQLRVEESTE
jgi:signal transduction histidine kinase